MDGVAALAATETLADPLGRRDVERWGLLVMERTQSHIVDTASAQGHEFRYHINNVGGIEYLFYCELVYHSGGRCIDAKITKNPWFGSHVRAVVPFLNNIDVCACVLSGKIIYFVT